MYKAQGTGHKAQDFKLKVTSCALYLVSCAFLLLCFSTAAQPSGNPAIKTITTSWKFDFSSGKTASGYIKISPATTFSYQSGYGFDHGSVVTATRNFITSDKPFFFSVALPDGNYNVKLILGDEKGASATTIRAECRRLMLQHVQTPF